MRRVLVRRIGFGAPVMLDQNEPRRVVDLLDDVEAQATRFEKAQAGIEARRMDEAVDRFRFYADLDMHDKHEREIGQIACKLKRALA